MQAFTALAAKLKINVTDLLKPSFLPTTKKVSEPLVHVWLARKGASADVAMGLRMSSPLLPQSVLDPAAWTKTPLPESVLNPIT